MKNRYYAIISLLILFPSCFFSTNDNATTTYFVQAPLDLSIVKELQESMQPAIEKILQEEIGTIDFIENDNKWALFFFKRRQAITIYYINDLYDDGKELMFSTIENLNDLPTPKEVTLSPDLRFFNEENKIIDLVMIIDDPAKELDLLNKEIKNTAHKANNEYELKKKKHLYDIAKSEKFLYLPHLSLGFLRQDAIRKLAKDSSKEKVILERIKERIIKALSDKLTELLMPETNKISFNSLSIYNVKKKEYIKDFPLVI